jgi:transposase InsO family protein
MDPRQLAVPNLLQRDFGASRPNSKWVTDITYIPTRTGWLYLAVVMDLYSRQIVGWAMQGRMDTALVQAALTMALQRRQPPEQLLHHSDRGRQYTSQAYQDALAAAHMQVSMSRVGQCYDNAPMESFFSTLKLECVYQHVFTSQQQARTILFEFIEVYYNRQRRHSTLDFLSPHDFEVRNAVC